MINFVKRTDYRNFVYGIESFYQHFRIIYWLILSVILDILPIGFGNNFV